MKHLISPVNAFAKTFALTLAIASASVVSAVPAYRGWQTFTQPDGSSVTVRHMGDEFYSYWENEQGQ